MMLAKLEFKKSGDDMTIEKLINELKTFGYDIYLEGENLRYKFHSLIEPPKDRIEVLLDSLKKNKPEVISYLRAQERPNKALSLHDAGVAIQKMTLSEFEQAGLTLKIWSEVLQDHIYFVSSDAVIPHNPLDAVTYTAKELTAMLDMEPEEVRTAHTVKSIFHKARVTEHKGVAA